MWADGRGSGEEAAVVECGRRHLAVQDARGVRWFPVLAGGEMDGLHGQADAFLSHEDAHRAWIRRDGIIGFHGIFLMVLTVVVVRLAGLRVKPWFRHRTRGEIFVSRGRE